MNEWQLNDFFCKTVTWNLAPDVDKGIYANEDLILRCEHVHMQINCLCCEVVFFCVEVWRSNIDDVKKMGCQLFIVGHFKIANNAIAIDQDF